MSPIMTRRTMDPRWPWHQRSVGIGMMNAEVEIFRRSGIGHDYGYDVKTGGLYDAGTGEYPAMLLLYRGQGRAASNKDWRARTRTARGVSGTLHAVRFQVPEADCPPIHAHDVVRVTSSPADEELLHFVFHVRNPASSSNAWLRNLLCDVDVAHPEMLPPPHTGTPVPPEQVPSPVSDCNCGGE